MRHKLIPVLLFLSASLELAAQTYEDQFTREYETIEFMSPTEWSFQKYMEHPISLYNGCPDVSINLFTLKDGEIELPITLRYNTSGIKVEEEASWVGLGWNLNVGGYISRVVVGGYDENDTVLTNHIDLFYNDSISPPFPYSQINYKKSMHTELADIYPIMRPSSDYWSRLSPDVFFYSLPGYSGRYCIDSRDNSVYHFLREHNISINHNSNNSYKATEKEIITPEGLKHRYAFLCNSTDYFTRDVISETYSLDKTLYPNGTEVTYSYSTSTYRKERDNHMFIGRSSTSSRQFFKNITDLITNTSIINVTEPILKQITTPNYKVEFKTSDRLDFPGEKLDTIKIVDKNSGTILKSFIFNYDYFKPIETVEQAQYNDHYRLKLLSVGEYDLNTRNIDNCHSFSYNETPLPSKTSSSKDYWGYPNSSSSIMAVSIPKLADLHWHRCKVDPDYMAMSNQQKIYSDRRHNHVYCQAGMLKRIVYPTGGCHEYNYESNSFVGTYIPSINENPPTDYPVISQYICDNNSGNSTSCSFTTSAARIFTINYRVSRGLGDWYKIKDVKMGVGYSTSSPTREFTTVRDNCVILASSNSSDGDYVGSFSLELPAGMHVFYVSLPDEVGDQSQAICDHSIIEATISYKDADPEELVPQVDTVSYGCGMRIKEILYFNKDGDNPVHKISYSYVDPLTGYSSGRLFDNPAFTKTYNAVYKFQADDPRVPAFNILTINDRQYELFDTNINDNPYGFASGVGYSYVTETISDSDGSKEYSFHNDDCYSGTHFSRISSVLNGKISGIKYKDDNGNILKEIKYGYSETLKDNFYSINYYNQIYKFPILIDEKQIIDSPGQYYPIGDYISFYPEMLVLNTTLLRAYDLTLSSEIVTRDGVTTTTRYTYDNETLLPKTKVTFMSDGTELETLYKYPKDIDVFPYDYLYEKHILTPVVEERHTHNGLVIHSKLTEIDSTGELERLSYGECQSASIQGITSSGFVSSTMYPHVTLECTRRDARQNPVCYRVNETEEIVYIWGYGYRYPVAEIKGTSYNEVHSALGCTPESLSGAVSPDFVKIESLRASLPDASITIYKYDLLGNITEIIDRRGHSTYYEYDCFGRLVKKQRANGSSIETIETFKYNTIN